MIFPTADKKSVLVVLAGPNGAGKTLFFELYIAPSGLPFVNADFIAKELAEKGKPVSAYDAARLAEQKRQEYVAEKRPFWWFQFFQMGRPAFSPVG